jgi:hypothetical protein
MNATIDGVNRSVVVVGASIVTNKQNSLLARHSSLACMPRLPRDSVDADRAIGSFLCFAKRRDRISFNHPPPPHHHHHQITAQSRPPVVLFSWVVPTL